MSNVLNAGTASTDLKRKSREVDGASAETNKIKRTKTTASDSCDEDADPMSEGDDSQGMIDI